MTEKKDTSIIAKSSRYETIRCALLRAARHMKRVLIRNTKMYAGTIRKLRHNETRRFANLTPDERGIEMADVLLAVEVEDIKAAILATTTPLQWMALPYLYRHMFPAVANSHLRILLEKAAAKENKEVYDAIKM